MISAVLLKYTVLNQLYKYKLMRVLVNVVFLDLEAEYLFGNTCLPTPTLISAGKCGIMILFSKSTVPGAFTKIISFNTNSLQSLLL